CCGFFYSSFHRCSRGLSDLCWLSGNCSCGLAAWSALRLGGRWFRHRFCGCGLFGGSGGLSDLRFGNLRLARTPGRLLLRLFLSGRCIFFAGGNRGRGFRSFLHGNLGGFVGIGCCCGLCLDVLLHLSCSVFVAAVALSAALAASTLLCLAFIECCRSIGGGGS